MKIMKKNLFFISILAIILLSTPLITQAVDIQCPLKTCDLTSIVTAIGDLLKVMAIAVGTVMIIISGIQYMTSAGNEEKASKARKTMLYTIIGVAIVLSVGFIMDLVKEIVNKQ